MKNYTGEYEPYLSLALFGWEVSCNGKGFAKNRWPVLLLHLEK
jgi:hypothetical protein